MLKVGLRSARHDVSWVNIWKDPAAAKFVASYRDGNETVPTAVTGSGRMLDASAGVIRAHLAASNDADRG